MKAPLKVSNLARAIEPTLIRVLRGGMRPTTIDFGLGQTDLPVTDVIRGDFRKRFDEPIRAPYTPNAGTDAAREAVARHVGVEPEEVLLTCGVQEGLAVAILGLCDPGDEVLVPDPGFPAYANLVRAAGAHPVEYPLRQPSPGHQKWDLDSQSILDRITQDTKLVILNNPGNPTGSVYSKKALIDVMKGLRERGIGWVSDEIYEDYIWEGSFYPARTADAEAGGPPGGITLSGLSKSHHLMGWRLGWMIAPAEVVKELTPLHQHLVTCAPLPAQQAAITALAHHQEAIKETLKVLGARRKRALEVLHGLGVIAPEGASGAFYLFLDVRKFLPTFDTTRQMAETLLEEEDVLAIPGEGFGPSGLGHLRVAYTIGGDPLEDGLGRLRRFLVRHQ